MIAYMMKHKELIPLFAVTGVGCVGAAWYLLRLATKNPDCAWDRKNNPHPWLNIAPNQRIKLFGHADISKFEDNRPTDLRNL